MAMAAWGVTASTGEDLKPRSAFRNTYQYAA
jgi:hypothetical protein